ncbi:GATA transcription factor [Striga asiatica]|uniref:GATA transcription factor n=1 Tax=Striga asiatica TaxID=4170 RepID=A0A5A7QA93_STRAF|nr:GATA transcription factor [Striga asiatica]
MYGPPHASMNNPTADHRLHRQGTTRIDEDDEDDVFQCSNGDESVENPSSQIGCDPANNSHSPHALATIEAPVEASGPHGLYNPDMDPAAPPDAGEGGADQLTLSFQGEVYVFDSVSPEKVQAVLLLLGGYEVPAGIPTPGMTPQNPRNMGDFPARSSHPQRAASLNRFREKRKERCFEKKIRYTVRKEVALRMQRKKGQFTSSKSVGEETGSSADWNGTSGSEEQETLCRHCGTSSKSTPMMRRGPDGPRTLCNACGLKWANKLEREANGIDRVLPPANMITSSSGDN